MRHGRPRRRAIGVVSATIALALAGAAGWSAGFVWFMTQMPRQVEDPVTVTDAIVVLTGGAGRLGEGLALLAEGRASKLFISGVYRGVDVSEILRVSRQAPEAIECCVELGHSAADTEGNARETAEWMAGEGFASLRLVTASYHMPRGAAEFRQAMPGVRVVPHPVFPERVRVDAWWRSPGTAALLAGEYIKYLLTLLRPARAVVE